jgi:RNA polymerase sigma-70 factor, ECF subfamily
MFILFNLVEKNNIDVNIQSLRKGDKKAFEKLYMTYFDMLYNLSNQYVHNPSLAEEIVQESFLRLWENRHNIEKNTNFKNLLYTIAKNKCLTYLRDIKTRLKHLGDLKYHEMQFNYAALEGLGDKLLEFDELQNKIQNVIDNFPEEIRQVFIMKRFDNLKYREIADKLNISQKTVEARISKALSILRQELKGYIPVILLLLRLLWIK